MLLTSVMSAWWFKMEQESSKLNMLYKDYLQKQKQIGHTDR